MPSLKKNLIYNVSYQILILAVPFITSPYVSRVLGPEGLGTYSVTTAIAKYFTIFALLGMTNYGNRTIAQSRGSRKTLSITFWNLYYFQLIASLSIFVFYLIYVYLLGYSLYGIISCCQIPYVLSTVFEVSWFFYGMEEFKGIVIRNAVVKVLTTILIFLFVRTNDDVWIYVLINALSLMIGQLCLWPFIKRYVSFEKPNFRMILSHFKPNCVLMVSVLAVSVYTLLDKIMLEWLSNTIEVGYYENTEKILTMANSTAGAIGAVMLPRISNLQSSGQNNQIIKYVAKSMKYIMIIAIAIAFGIAGISRSFSILYFGKEFENCGLLLTAIAPAIVFYSWSNILRNQYLLPNNLDSVFVIATLSASIVNLILNIILIPMCGALGAVIGTVGAQFCELSYQSYKVRKDLSLKKYFFNLVPYIVFGIMMFVICKIIELYMGISVVSLSIQILFGSISFVLMVSIFFCYTKDELLYNFIKKFK